MKILIVGAGIVGRQLARDLSSEGHDVTLLEQDEGLLSQIKGNLDVLCVQGDGTCLATLEKVGIRQMELVITATRSDGANAIICLLAGKFGVPKKIARIRDADWFRSGMVSEEEFAIDKVINLDQAIVDYVRKIVTTPGLVDFSYFTYTGISLLGFRVFPGTPLTGKRLSEISQTFSLAPFLFATIYRKGEMIIPDGDDMIEAGDICYILTGDDMVPFILPIFNKSLEPMSSVIIYGANNIGLSLAKELEKIVQQVVLIEPDEKKAIVSAEKL
ncbi:MAG: NAD-binding protein, partial [Nitrospinota bacterium]